ncbi:MAG: hypothetical protein LIO96_08655 [Lachnospiraceae bacterium]|nr:hypothetical protein [Lachnospiraceae bacterium]
MIVLAVVVVGAIAFMFYSDKTKKSEQTAAMQALQEEAKPYEEERESLETELADLEDGVFYASEEAKTMVGFAVSEVSDLTYMEELAETYDFPPVLVLDCVMDLEDAEELIDAADADWEIMLYVSDFSEETNDSVLSVMDYMETAARGYTGVFFLRNDFSTDENIRLLKEDGFTGYTVYNSDSPDAGQMDDGTVYFDYSYLSTSGTSVGSRISAMYRNKAAMIYVLDMESINAGTLSKDYVTDLMDKLQEYAEYDDCSFSTVADVVAELSQINAIEEKNQTDYEERAAEMEERIDELSDMIHEIYSRMEY